MTLAMLIGIGIKISLFLVVFGAGLNAPMRGATYLFRHPGQLVRMIVAMHVVMLALTLFIAFTFDLHFAVKVALVVLAVAPVPPVLPGKAVKAGGEESYAIGFLVAASLLALVLVPASIGIIGWVRSRPHEIPAAAVAVQVLTSVLLPLAAGMVVRRLAPGVNRYAKPVATAGSVLLLVCFLPYFYVARHEIVSLIGNGTVLAFVAFCVVGLAAGHLLGGPTAEDRTVLAIASASRHPGIAIAVVHADFPDQKLVIPAVLLYLIVSGVVVAPYMKWAARREKNLTTSTGVSHG